MQEFVSKVLTYAFVVIVYLFIYSIIRMIFLDIHTMYRKKSGGYAQAYIKLINLRQGLDFPVEESYEIGDNYVIGRGKNCNISILDKFLSTKNTRIFKSSGKFYIEDLDSTNGSFLNGERLTDKAIELRDGDKIKAGRLNFLFVMPTKDDE